MADERRICPLTGRVEKTRNVACYGCKRTMIACVIYDCRRNNTYRNLNIIVDIAKRSLPYLNRYLILSRLRLILICLFQASRVSFRRSRVEIKGFDHFSSIIARTWWGNLIRKIWIRSGKSLIDRIHRNPIGFNNWIPHRCVNEYFKLYILFYSRAFHLFSSLVIFILLEQFVLVVLVDKDRIALSACKLKKGNSYNTASKTGSCFWVRNATWILHVGISITNSECTQRNVQTGNLAFLNDLLD